MTEEIGRLARLASSQAKLAELLESRIIATRSELSRLRESRRAILVAAERMGAAGLSFHAAAMRRILAVDQEIASRDRHLKELGRKLIDAKSRHELCVRRISTLTVGEMRRLAEIDMLEQVASAKARGKLGVLD